MFHPIRLSDVITPPLGSTMMHRIALGIAMLCLPDAAFAAGTCQSSKMLSAEREVNRMVAILVNNAPIECKVLPAKKNTGQCSFLCVSTYTMTDAQHRSAQVYLTGAVGQQINKLGSAQFDNVTLIDRSLAQQGYALRISAADAARIQHQASTDQLDAPGLINAVTRAFRRVSTK